MRSPLLPPGFARAARTDHLGGWRVGIPRVLVPMLLLLAGATAAAARPPEVVSPGSEDGAPLVEASCPTFSWGLLPGARRYDLEVLALDGGSRSAAPRAATDPVLAVELPGSVSSWTPAGALCLERGRAYRWRLRAHDLVGAGPWSRSLGFRLRPATAPDERTDPLDPIGPDDDPPAYDPSTPWPPAQLDAARAQPPARPDSAPSGEPQDAGHRVSGHRVAGQRVAASAVDLDELISQMRVNAENFTVDSAAAVVGVQTMNFPLIEAQPGYGVLGIAIRNGSSHTAGVRGEADNGTGVEGEGGTGVFGTGVDGVIGTGSLRGGNFLGTGTGVGVRARSGSNDVADLVLAANGPGSERGILRTDPAFSNSDLFLESNDAVVVQLDVDADTADSDFIVRDENGSNLFEVDDGGAVRVLGSIVHGSDRERKVLHRRVDQRALLELLVELPLYQWSWKDGPAETHVGPTAQDFQETFGLGSDPRSVATIDLDGVALAAIQGLHRLVVEQGEEIERLRRELRRADRGLP